MVFEVLTDEQMLEVDGGIAVSGVLAIASGVCYVVSGVSALCGNKKVAAWFCVAGGVCDVAAGVCMLLP